MKRILTGIQPTGEPHLGNYVGAIEPALRFAKDPVFQTNIFIADYHALNSQDARTAIGSRSYAIAATLLALGLDPSRTLIYRQSDVPETFELAVFLNNFTPKGLINRSHAYKAAIQNNNQKGIEDTDSGINMGLFNYPILMTADILLFDADLVPVGADQRQHIEIARDIAGSVNAAYGSLLKQPEAYITGDDQELPGIDGRKMSKSYGNTLPIFASPEAIAKACMSIKTDSRLPAEPKDKDQSIILKMYRAVATSTDYQTFADRFLPGGMGYGQAKKELASVVSEKFNSARGEYTRLSTDRNYLNSVLLDGAKRARELAGRKISDIHARLQLS